MSERQPNILWICTDQQRWDTLGCYGNSFVRTPNIDALAAGGALFERCFSQSPVCTPSRASFLTGRYPRTTRCRQNGQDIPEDEVLVTKLLADAGYRCGLSGKLHLSPCNPSHCTTTERRIDDGYTDADFHWSHHERRRLGNQQRLLGLAGRAGRRVQHVAPSRLGLCHRGHARRAPSDDLVCRKSHGFR